MKKQTIAILLTVLFMALISAPSIIVAIDDSVDTSMFYGITEEENQTFKLTLTKGFGELQNFFVTPNKQYSGYQHKTYPKPHLNLISPPPELHIL